MPLISSDYPFLWVEKLGFRCSVSHPGSSLVDLLDSVFRFSLWVYCWFFFVTVSLNPSLIHCGLGPGLA